MAICFAAFAEEVAAEEIHCDCDEQVMLEENNGDDPIVDIDDQIQLVLKEHDCGVQAHNSSDSRSADDREH